MAPPNKALIKDARPISSEEPLTVAHSTTDTSNVSRNGIIIIQAHVLPHLGFWTLGWQSELKSKVRLEQHQPNPAAPPATRRALILGHGGAPSLPERRKSEPSSCSLKEACRATF